MPIESKAATSVALAFAAALLSASAMARPSAAPSTAPAGAASTAALSQLQQLMARVAPATQLTPTLAPEPWLEMGPPIAPINCVPGWCEFAHLR